MSKRKRGCTDRAAPRKPVIPLRSDDFRFDLDIALGCVGIGADVMAALGDLLCRRLVDPGHLHLEFDFEAKAAVAAGSDAHFAVNGGVFRHGAELTQQRPQVGEDAEKVISLVLNMTQAETGQTLDELKAKGDDLVVDPALVREAIVELSSQRTGTRQRVAAGKKALGTAALGAAAVVGVLLVVPFFLISSVNDKHVAVGYRLAVPEA